MKEPKVISTAAFKRSYIVDFGPDLPSCQVNCDSVEFRDGAVIFFDHQGLPLCAFTMWESIEVMSQITGQGNGWKQIGGKS